MSLILFQCFQLCTIHHVVDKLTKKHNILARYTMNVNNTKIGSCSF